MRNLGGSLLSAFVGWLTGVAILLGRNWIQYFSTSQAERAAESLWGWAIVAYFAAVFVLGTWLFLLLPLYTWVPSEWLLWRWPVCTVCGTAAGAVIMYWVMAFASSQPVGWNSLIFVAGAVGGATCLFGSLTRKRFKSG